MTVNGRKSFGRVFQSVDGIWDIVQMVVEQAAFVSGFRFDPAPAGEVDGVYSFLRQVDEGIGIEAEVNCIGVQVMQVEEQIAVCRSGRISLVQTASLSWLAGGSIKVATFSTNGIVPTIFCGGAIPRGAFDRCLGSWRCGERSPISSPPPLTKARCSDQNSGCISSASRAVRSNRFESAAMDEARPSVTPCNATGTWVARVFSARRFDLGASK